MSPWVCGDTFNYSCGCQGSCNTDTEPGKDLPSISCLTTGFLHIAPITVLKERWFIPCLFLCLVGFFFQICSPQENLATVLPLWMLKDLSNEIGSQDNCSDIEFSVFSWQQNQRWTAIKKVISEWVKLAIKEAYLKQGKTSPEALVHRNAHSSRSLSSFRKEACILRKNI